MANLTPKRILCSLLLLIICSYTSSLNLDEQKEWLRNVANAKQKTAMIRIYVHDILGGPNATLWEVARSNISHTSPTTFGQVMVLDDFITAKPGRNSRVIGRAQGIIASSDLETSAITMNLNYVFTAGKYNGSSFSILGRNEFFNETRELPVVGGTGVFRMARGFSVSRTYTFDSDADHAVMEHNVFLVYLE